MFILEEHLPDEIKSIAKASFDYFKLSGDAYVEVEIVTVEQIRQINFSIRNIDKPTDVLSFPMLDGVKSFTIENYPHDYDDQLGAVVLGSIVICKEIMQSQAMEYGHGEIREMAYLFLHGLLHLLGYDHMTKEDKMKMRKAEEEILLSQNIGR